MFFNIENKKDSTSGSLWYQHVVYVNSQIGYDQ